MKRGQENFFSVIATVAIRRDCASHWQHEAADKGIHGVIKIKRRGKCDGEEAFSSSLESTYLVGASCSSISPLMKAAMLWVAALTSSCDVDTLSFAISSSRTLMDRAFSFFAICVESMTATDGMVIVGGGRRGEVEEGKRGRVLMRRG